MLSVYQRNFVKVILKIGLICLFQSIAFADAATPYARQSQACASCHSEIYNHWSTSHHALAHREVNLNEDSEAFQKLQNSEIETVRYQSNTKSTPILITETHSDNKPYTYPAKFVIGVSPLRQYVVQTYNGRYQANELAFDPHKKEWFNVFGSEHRQVGEWGQWQGRGMNWNSMCAQCHLTDYSKNYNPISDSYNSTWTEQGVGCVQCHGNLTKDHEKNNKTETASLQTWILKRKVESETCAPCHARNEVLKTEPRAGLNYNDHFRLTLPTDSAIFYPDGQMRDEDFNWTSFQTSRMGGKGQVSCLDCHDSHTGKTLLSTTNNALCLQCHVANNTRNAPVVDPKSHSHHQAGSAGNLCINCHMPTTVYMQRDARHDHGFLRPDPLLTKELSIPNACSRCHTDKSIDSLINTTNTWYGDKMESRQRQRARAVSAAEQVSTNAETTLLKLIATEDIPAWKATLVQLSRPWAAEQNVRDTLTPLLGDTDPLVRSAVVQVLGTQTDLLDLITPYLKDASRLVRLDAEWALSARLDDTSNERKELNDYLALNADQPAGQVRIAEDLFNRNHISEAEAPLRKALSWDSNNPEAYHSLGIILDNLHRTKEASESLWKAAQLDTHNAVFAFQAGLEFANSGNTQAATKALQEAVLRDPTLDRAWYNLGLLLNQAGQIDEAIKALLNAEHYAPTAPEYPYARATILWKKGDHVGAKEAAKQALILNPNLSEARSLLNEP
jgi:predicted CXXCH cytochrome family protein